MKRFWLKLLLLLLPIPLLVIGFNWLVDPVHLRSADQYEYGIAHLILQGKPVTNISNPNEALYLKHYVAGLTNRKDVLVLGSSRSKLIRADSFPGLSFFNNSIGGAGLVDYLAIYQMYRQKQLLPSIAVIELSPWVLERDYSSVWKELNATRAELEHQILPSSPAPPVATRIQYAQFSQVSEFVSFGYFQTSFYTWLRGLTKPTHHRSTYFAWEDGTLPVGETLLADGSTIYPERIQNQKEEEHVTALAIEYGQKPIGIPDHLDPGREQVLEAFLDRLQQDGVQVIFYLPPYHPRTYDMMTGSAQNRIIVEAQLYFEELARRKGLTIIGSYNPSDLSLGVTAFFDGSHPTPEAVRGLFNRHELASRASPQALPGPDTRLELAGVENENGLEAVNGHSFFWIGNGDTCLHLRSSRAGVAVITFHADAGPSLPQTPQRNLLLKTARGYSRSILIPQSTEVAISFPMEAGLNNVCLTPLDKPTVREQSNGDRRPLLIGVSNLQARLLPEGAIPPDGTVFPFEFAAGWHPVERSAGDWLCWTDGRGRLSVTVATDTTVIATGEILSALRPNDVTVIVNGEKIKTLAVDWKEWAFRAFEPLRFQLKAGQNSIEFISENPPIVQQADPRPLAVAIKNLVIVPVYSR